MWIVTEEDDEGMWFDGPHGFQSQAEAREFVAKQRPPQAGYSYVLYRCDEVATLPAA
jgi:hypothetical protein